MSEDNRHGLSDAEVRLLGLVCEGLTNPEIAARLSAVMRKLGLRNRVQLAVWAVLHGLYPPRG